MPDNVNSTGTKAATTKAMATGPRNYFEIEGRGFTVGQNHANQPGVTATGRGQETQEERIQGQSAKEKAKIYWR